MTPLTNAPGCQSTVQEKLAWARERWPDRDLEAAGIVLRICRARDMLFAGSRRVLDRVDLAPAEFETLLTLLKQPPPHCLTPGEIGAAIGVTSGGMTKVANKLVERGLVSRSVSPADRRSRVLELTSDGAALAASTLGAIIDGHTATMSDTLTPRQRAEFTDLLERLLGALEGASR